MRFVFTFLFLSSVIYSDKLCAKVYKWVDENGKTHYSDKPIDDTSKEVKLKKGPSEQRINEAKQRTRKQLSAYKRLGESVDKERKDRMVAAKKQEKEAKETRAACKEAKRLVRVYSSGNVVYQEGENGKRTYMGYTDEEKNKKLATLEDFIKNKCP